MRFLPLLLALVVSSAHAAEPAVVPTIVPVDLVPLIEAAADKPNQFAADVPYRASLRDSGTWSSNGSMRIWRHAVRIPDAVSLSFHAQRLQLPDSALLTVRGLRSTTTYTTEDAGGGEFWSRVQPGDTLELTLEVAAGDRDRVELEITSLQAGYRGLSPDVQSHAYFRRMRAQAAGDPDTQCVENYMCHVTPQNSPAGKATVAITISNVFLCTGTMINNTANDGTPYLITARHCQNGRYGGGAPQVASTVVVYWNAESACGSALETVFYSPNLPRQSGATTVVEQQDHWLLRLNEKPVVSDAWLVGFDATGSSWEHAYSIHHSQSYTKQFTRWKGPAYVEVAGGILGTGFVTTFLHTRTEFGTSAPGSSGGAMFSPQDRLIGVSSLAVHQGTVSQYGLCPMEPVPVPTLENAVVTYNALSAVFNSTEDLTSTTGTLTLKSFLDPTNSGVLVHGSIPAPPGSPAAALPPVTGGGSSGGGASNSGSGGGGGGGAFGLWSLLLAGGLVLARAARQDHAAQQRRNG